MTEDVKNEREGQIRPRRITARLLEHPGKMFKAQNELFVTADTACSGAGRKHIKNKALETVCGEIYGLFNTR